jgi:hypothetical protein
LILCKRLATFTVHIAKAGPSYVGRTIDVPNRPATGLYTRVRGRNGRSKYARYASKRSGRPARPTARTPDLDRPAANSVCTLVLLDPWNRNCRQLHVIRIYDLTVSVNLCCDVHPQRLIVPLFCLVALQLHLYPRSSRPLQQCSRVSSNSTPPRQSSLLGD